MAKKEYDFRGKLFHVDPAWQKTLKRLDDMERLRIWDAIMSYRTDGEEVSLTGKISERAEGVYWSILDTLARLDSNAKDYKENLSTTRSEIGKKGAEARWRDEEEEGEEDMANDGKNGKNGKDGKNGKNGIPNQSNPNQSNPNQSNPDEAKASLSKKKEKKESFVKDNPPTREEVEAYVKEKGYIMNIDKFFGYYTSQNWKKSNGQYATSWRGLVATFASDKKNYYEERKNTLLQDDSTLGRFNKLLLRKFPFIVGHMDTLLTENELQRLLSIYTHDQVISTLCRLEDRQDYTRKHTNLMLTIIEWIDKQQEDGTV